MPRKTLVDFTLTFEESKRAEDVARVLFTTVQRTERLDDMPVLPATLKIKGIIQNVLIDFELLFNLHINS